MPDIIVERAEKEEANRVAKEANRAALIAAALAPVVEPAVIEADKGWVLADE